MTIFSYILELNPSNCFNKCVANLPKLHYLVCLLNIPNLLKLCFLLVLEDLFKHYLKKNYL